MTTTYDPHHPTYVDEADVRDELTRVFDVCQGCRRCVDLCASFPTLFDLLDRFDDRDAGRLTPLEQDRVVEACFQCTRCSVGCPYRPEVHETAVDFPHLMLRAEAMRHVNGHQSRAQRTARRTMTHPDTIGRLGSFTAPLANRITGAAPGSLVRKLLATITGVSAKRSLPRFAGERFSGWFARRTGDLGGRSRQRVTVFPTCIVEYQDVEVGRDLVQVYEHNGIECTLSTARCCGAPSLHAGDLRRFERIADANVRTLAAEIRSNGGDVVVPQPSCARVLCQDYPRYCSTERRADALLLVEHTFDASAYLVWSHVSGTVPLGTEFVGKVPDHIVHVTDPRSASRSTRSTGSSGASGSAIDDLLALTGATVTTVDRSSGVDGLWGLRHGTEAVAVPIAQRLATTLAAEIERLDDGDEGSGSGDTVIVGDSSLANTVIAEQVGDRPLHPLSLMRRAYGLDVGPSPG